MRWVTGFAALFIASFPWAGLPAELTLVEIGGSFAPGNLATEPGAVAFAIDSLADIGIPIHAIPNLNDGIYGNSNSWIGLTGSPGFAGIAFGGLKTVSSIAFGRDNTGHYADRTLGTYTLQYTQVPSPDKNTPNADWITIGSVTYNCAFPPGSPAVRHRYNFPTVQATGIRLIVPETGIQPNGTCIDELEVYSEPGAVLVDPPPPLLELKATGGPVSTPAAPEDVPTLEQGNLARSPDAVPFSTPPYPLPIHDTVGLNDGRYGNSNSWLGNAPGPASGKVYAGIYFTGGAKKIAQIALGRDNTGQYADRAAGPHVVQYTQAEFDFTDDAQIDAAPWITLGIAADHCLGGDPRWRRLYSFAPVTARAVRVLTQLGNVIDELEVGEQIGTPPPPELRLVAKGGPIATPAAPGDVPTFEQGNLARAADAIPFATPPFPAPAHTIPHLNDGLYGNANSWLGNEPGAASGKVYAGIYFAEGPVRIQRIALGRDNTGGFSDRADEPYLVQYTLAEFDPSDDAAVEAALWSTAGQASAHLTDGARGLRHVYCLEGIRARAVRVIVALGSALDEIELLAAPPPIEEAVLAEVGGTFAPDNLATAPGAVAFAIDALVDLDPSNEIFARHQIPHLNDGVYGNSKSWIGLTGDPAFAGIAFGAPKTVASVAFGRDNTGEYDDRVSGTYALQYTVSDAPGASTSDCDWVTIAFLEYDAFCPPRPGLRHRYNFTPVVATAIRLVVPEAGIQPNGTCIDEIEVYSEPAPVTEPSCIRPKELALLETGGPLTTPAAPGDVPTLAQGNLARSPDAVPFSTPPYPLPIHDTVGLNDGFYGNSNSWLGNAPGPVSGKVYGGVYFRAGTKRIRGIALGRDNTGQYADRTAGSYLVEFTLEEFDYTDDAAVDAVRWVPVGLASAHLTDGLPGLRHRYGFDEIEVRAVRVRTAVGNLIDELELFGEPPKNSPPRAIVKTEPDPATVVLSGGLAQVTLDGSASDDGDGGSQGLVFAWEKVSGPEGDSIATPSGSITIVTFTRAGTYVYRLTVDDRQPSQNTASAEVEITVLPEPAKGFRRGDANVDGRLDISDPIAVLSYLFLGTGGEICQDAADSDDSGELNITDGIYTLNYLFMGGDPIPAPGPEACGPDPSDDSLPECVYPEEFCT